MEKHSDKALKTLTLMGTKPGDWRHARIKWVKVKRLMPDLVRCPRCRGDRYVRYAEDGTVIPPPDPSKDYYAWNQYIRDAEAEARKSGHPPFNGNCKNCTCHNPRSRDYGRATGRVKGVVMKEVMVGYVEWPEGVRFDSRFDTDSHCQLCNKAIRDPFGFVPVTGTGSDKKAHGMWVGRDCATRFLSVDPVKEKDGIIDRKDTKKT